MRTSRWILQTLILSVALNATLLGTFFYFIIRDNPLHFAYHPKEHLYSKSPPIPPGFLSRLHSLSFDQVLEFLEDEREVEQGYLIRDFALGALASFHDFDVQKALGSKRLLKKIWEVEGGNFCLFPALQDEDFQHAQTYAYTHPWPLTSKGLFKRLSEQGIESCPPTLLNSFCHTPEFILLETLFSRSQIPIQKRTLLTLALEGGWEKLTSYHEKQQQCADFSEQARLTLLREYLEGGSKMAASLLSGYLDKEENLAGHLYEKPGNKHLRPSFRQAPPAAPTPATHIVEPGQSLWQIARKYQIPLNALMEANHLDSTVIRPGKALKIPLN